MRKWIVDTPRTESLHDSFKLKTLNKKKKY